MTKKIGVIPVEHKVLALLDNFQSELSEIKLSEKLSIMKVDELPEDERSVFDGSQHIQKNISFKLGEDSRREQDFTYIIYEAAGGQLFQRTLERSNHVLCWYIKDRFPEPVKKYYDFLLEPQRQFDNMLSALRVLKGNPIGLFPYEDFIIDLPIPKEFKRGTIWRHNGYLLSAPQDVEPYVLQATDIQGLIDLLGAIDKVKHSALKVALSRLDDQYTRTSVVDRIIDAVVALEALYAGDGSNEIILRIALRASTHLGGNNPDRREQICSLCNLAYNLRSRLVHGSIHTPRDVAKEVHKKGWADENAFVIDLDEMLRQALQDVLLHLGNRKLKEAFHEPLDKAIRRGEAFLWN